jgi:hypothetical protein
MAASQSGKIETGDRSIGGDGVGLQHNKKSARRRSLQRRFLTIFRAGFTRINRQSSDDNNVSAVALNP